ncbi:MAG: hypothetical protein JXN65_03765 [Clostridia bacterium]|nr:hypothetical protein [Clostridia bacterium]
MKSNYILYTRTENRDYRWIYNIEGNDELKKHLLSHYRSYSKDREHLYYININNNACFYKILHAPWRDGSGRDVYMLEGIIFEKKCISIVDRLLPYLFLYYLENPFYVPLLPADDEYNEKQNIEIQIDQILDNVINCYLSNNEYAKLTSAFNTNKYVESINMINSEFNIAFFNDSTNDAQTKSLNPGVFDNSDKDTTKKTFQQLVEFIQILVKNSKK